ncbi:hypothetical protein AB0I28_39355 [Phytomonospora sp. NPDC050363]|uniref:hypothetical protein n=1 Tax=Phytomonospora sp. NPDC050363 TaxID=3155642 RepID=UPI0033F540A7
MRFDRFQLVTAYLRCSRCQITMGRRAPVMGHAVHFGGWQISSWHRRPGSSGRARHADADNDELYIPGDAKGIRLRCRRCRLAPRPSLEKVLAWAEELDYRQDPNPRFPQNGIGDIYF